MSGLDDERRRQTLARARLRAALRCVCLLRRATERPKGLATTVDRYDGQYDWPDSDARERCAGCGVYSANHGTRHEPGCLVVEAARALRAFDVASRRR